MLAPVDQREKGDFLVGEKYHLRLNEFVEK
jgi:hypothetical protein